MNPITSDIFGRLDWITKRLKNIYGRLTALETGGGVNPDTCYLEIISSDGTFPFQAAKYYNESGITFDTPFTMLIQVGPNVQRL